jgi:hypothetical protein
LLYEEQQAEDPVQAGGIVNDDDSVATNDAIRRALACGAPCQGQAPLCGSLSRPSHASASGRERKTLTRLVARLGPVEAPERELEVPRSDDGEPGPGALGVHPRGERRQLEDPLDRGQRDVLDPRHVDELVVPGHVGA